MVQLNGSRACTVKKEAGNKRRTERGGLCLVFHEEHKTRLLAESEASPLH